VPRLFFPAIFDPSVDRLFVSKLPLGPKMPLWKAVAFAGGLGLSMLSYPVNAATANGGDTVQALYTALLDTMKNGRTLGQSGRFTQLAPVIRRSFDIATMARLRSARLGRLCEAQRQQVTEISTPSRGLCRPLRQL
jgi:hypothetical protein